MKKWIAILLAVVMVLGMAACGTINEKEVSILWADEGVATNPNTLINAMDRAMYIEKIAYKHYGAAGDVETQLSQAEEALNNGCAALLVNLVDPNFTKDFVELAREKDAPVIFFDCKVNEKVVESYNKALVANNNEASVGDVQGKLISDYVLENYEKLDRNGDGKISYVAFGDVYYALNKANAALTAAEKEAPVFYDAENVDGMLAGEDVKAQMSAILAEYTDENKNMVELVVTDSDALALEAIAALQAEGYNSDRLTTHCIPVFGVGATADASAFANTANMSEEEKAQFVYTTLDMIGSGRMAGTAMPDNDKLAETIAASVANIIAGVSPVKGLDNTLVNKLWKLYIPYTIYLG